MTSIKKLVGALALAFAASHAMAVAYTPDTLLGSSNLGNSGDATEEAALEALLGFDVTIDAKVEDADALAQMDDDGNWYIDVDPNTPGYFLLKLGTGGTGQSDDTYFFENIAELTKLVWTNADVNFLTGGDCGANNQNACNIGRLSHYTSFNGDGGNDDGGDGGNDDGGDGGNDDGTVPEPGSIGLIGLALAGVAMARRRRK